MRVSLVLAALGASVALPAQAAAPEVEGAVYVERIGERERFIEPAGLLKRGDKVVLLVRWRTDDERDGFTVTTPVPPALAFQRGSADGVEVSADGGRSWGPIDRLRGARVTHLRWKVGARQASHGSGSFAYSATVR